jgi:hypothetical protein
MDLTTAARHDELVRISASQCESKALPKQHDAEQILTWNSGEGAYSLGDGDGQTPIWAIPFISS